MEQPETVAPIEGLRQVIAESLAVACPVHRMRDCSPLLNGCRWPATVGEQTDAVLAVLTGRAVPMEQVAVYSDLDGRLHVSVLMAERNAARDRAAGLEAAIDRHQATKRRDLTPDQIDPADERLWRESGR